MNGHPTDNVDVFLTRLKLLNYYIGKVKEFNSELNGLDLAISNVSGSSGLGVQVPYGKTEVIDGKSVVIESRYVSIPVTRNGFAQPNQDILWRMEELETMIIQYQCEIDFLVDTLEVCSDIVCIAARRIYVDGDNQEIVANDIPLDRRYLIRLIKKEISQALKSPNGTEND